MGLLDKVDAKGGPGETSASETMRSVITDFYQENPLFHCVVLRYNGEQKGLSDKIAEIAACHGAVCGDLSDRTYLLLLPGDLDMELFSHRISRSTGSTVAFQFTADSPSIAFDTLYSYLP